MADLALRLGKDMLVVDGSMATMLESQGLDISDCVAFYNISDEETVQTIHKLYKQAGADCISTNTFQANRIALQKFDLEEQVEAINTKAVKLAKSVKPQHVLASVGPLGVMDYPSVDRSLPEGALLKDIEEKEALATSVFTEQLKALLLESPDAILFETFTSLDEAVCAVSCAKLLTDLPIIMSFSFTSEERLPLTDETVEEVAQNFERIGADVYGMNCMAHEEIVKFIPQFKKATDKPLLVMPSAGLPQTNSLGDKIYPLSSDDMARYANEYRDLGVQFIGGCCGTQAAHIAAIFSQIHKKDVKVQ